MRVAPTCKLVCWYSQSERDFRNGFYRSFACAPHSALVDSFLCDIGSACSSLHGVYRQIVLRSRMPITPQTAAPRMSPTMREVAQIAGVSPATVSRVLNKTAVVAEETERRVLEVVWQMRYYKNVHARRLATGQSNLFGLVISEIANPYFPELIQGFQLSAWDQGFDVLLCTQYDRARAKAIMHKLIESDVRGVAIMTASMEP